MLDTSNIIEVLVNVLVNLAVITGVLRSKLKTLELNTSVPEVNNSNDQKNDLVETVSKIYNVVKNMELKISDLSLWRITWMELSESPVFLTDSDGNVYWVNNQFLKKTGTTLHEVVGDNWTKVIHSDEVNSVIEEYNNCIKHKILFYRNFKIVNQITKQESLIECRCVPIGTSSNSEHLGIFYRL